MGPWKSWVARSLGDLYIQQQQLEQAQSAYRLAQQLNPNDIESGIALSLTHIEQTDLGNARLVLEGMLSRGIVDARSTPTWVTCCGSVAYPNKPNRPTKPPWP